MITISDLFDTSKTIAAPLFDGKAYPWEVLGEIESFIQLIGKSLPEDEFDNPKKGVWIAKDATVFDSAYIGENVIIDHNAFVGHCAYIRGNVIIGKNSTVGNSTELKNAVLFDCVEVPHFNYVGDSILGYHSHLGAGAIASNFRLDRQKIKIKTDSSVFETGRDKVGAFLGDYSEVGANSVLNPGTIVIKHSVIYPLSSVSGVYKG